MAAAAAMQCKHLPDGGIHWLQGKPWLCFIGRCAPHCTAGFHMVVEIVIDLPAFFVVLNLLLVTTIS
jgi:hypothetical protein